MPTCTVLCSLPLLARSTLGHRDPLVSQKPALSRDSKSDADNTAVVDGRDDAEHDSASGARRGRERHMMTRERLNVCAAEVNGA